jgi:3-oxoacyl-[acyl-carrier-protein] synthase II
MDHPAVSITGVGVCASWGQGAAADGLAGLLPDDLTVTAALRRGRDDNGGERERATRYRDHASELALGAAGPALRDARLPGGLPDESIATVVSTSYSALENVCAAVDTIDRSSAAALSPMNSHAMSSHVVASWVTIRYGLRGPCLTLCDGPPSGLDALYWARNLILARRARAVLVIGVEPDTAPVGRLLGDRARRFDGAVAVVVEPRARAADRGARPYADLGGYARGAALADVVSELGHDPVGLWLPPEDPSGPADLVAADLVAAERTLDLEARLGRSAGALGVLQCAVAAVLIDSGAVRSALAGCGGADGTDAAALAFVAPPDADRRRPPAGQRTEGKDPS